MLQAAGDVNIGFREAFPFRRYTTWSGDMKPLVTYDWLDDHPCGYVTKMSTYQPFIEDAMDSVGRARGVQVNTGWQVTDVVQNDDGVEVTPTLPHQSRS